jgi:hypothetical protein
MNYRAVILKALNFLFARFDRRIEVVEAIKKDPGRIFKGRTLKKIEDLYWVLDPMPSEKELEIYYKNEYWNHRNQPSLVSERDLLHFNLIIGLEPDFFKVKRKIMNYGAGPGGVSFLFSAAGHEVINIEPSVTIRISDFGIRTYASLEEYVGQDIDLVYGSHSLEHVSDVHSVLEALNKRLKSDSYSFWEVPNALGNGNGPMESKIYIPHTYYFTKRFFEVCYQNVRLNIVGTDKSSYGSDPVFDESVQGDVIRFFGSKYYFSKELN